MSASSVEQNSSVLTDGELLELNALHAVVSRIDDADSAGMSDAEVCDVIHEMRRPWELHPFPRNVLNPQVIDIRRRRMAAVSVSDCPVCDGRQGVPTFEIRGLRHRLLTCVDCGLGRLHPLPSPEEIAAFYPSEYYGSPGAKFEPFTEAVVRWVGTIHVQALSRELSPGSRILDVGCGRGVLLSSLADRGHEVHGMDVSETAVQGVDPRAKIQVGPCLTEVGYPADHFDQVILWHVLEHLRNPREVLNEVNRILKPGGQVIIAVPNFSSLQARWSGAAWFHLDLPRHLFHFPVAGLRRLMERSEFEIVREQHFSLRQNPFGWLQSAMNKSSHWPRNGLYNLLHNHNVAGDTLSRTQQHFLKVAYLTGMPCAAVLSTLETVLRSGASVCVVGRKR